MLFNSQVFLLVFLPAVWTTFWLLRSRALMAELFLLTASVVFYAWGSPWLAALIGGSICFNFAMGRWLARSSAPWRRLLFTAAVAGDIGLLAYFKYANFIADNINAMVPGAVPHVDIALPLGISFFTFQQLGYLADVAATSEAEPSLRRYGLMVAFFPHLVAGPIVHHRVYFAQMDDRAYQKTRALDVAVGLTWMAVGLAKKVLFADSVGRLADAVFASNQVITPADAWLGSLAFTLQIYFDFSGYSDMAVGLGRLFGFRLPVNFRSPYQASSIIGFWRTWHITLSDFLRAYVYIPLGGSRRGFPRQVLNVLFVMLVGGLWHGASWTFVAWGGLHGVLLAINHAWRRLTGDRPGGRLAAVAGWAGTFLSVTMLWVLFRARSFRSAIEIWRALARAPDAVRGLVAGNLVVAAPLAADATALSVWTLVAILAALLLLVWTAPGAAVACEWLERALDEPGTTRGTALAIVAVAIGMLLAVSLVDVGAPREFIYFRF